MPSFWISPCFIRAALSYLNNQNTPGLMCGTSHLLGEWQECTIKESILCCDETKQNKKISTQHSHLLLTWGLLTFGKHKF